MYRAAITEPATYGEDVMAAKRTWSDLDESTRKLIIRRGRADLILRLRAATTAVAIRLTCTAAREMISAPGCVASRAKDRSGQDLGLLALELLGRDDTPVAQVSELGQLGRRALLACGLLDITAEGLVLLLRLLCRPLMHTAAAGDQVHQDTDQRDEQHEQEPQRLAPAGQVLAAEDVDEHGDQDPEPDHEQEDLQDRPEHPEQRVGVGTRSEQHGVSLTCNRLASAAGGCGGERERHDRTGICRRGANLLAFCKQAWDLSGAGIRHVSSDHHGHLCLLTNPNERPPRQGRG